jgi:hypothetical protein
MDYLNIGAAPCDENPEQVGDHYLATRAKQECREYIAQLRRQFGDEPEGAKLRIEYFHHDFGTYMEVVCYFSDEVSLQYALNCESEAWPNWDETARENLGLASKKGT